MEGSNNARPCDPPDRSSETDDTDSDPDRDLSVILRYLISSGQVRILSDTETLYDPDDSDEESFPVATPPKGDPLPDTSVLDVSDFRQNILLNSGAFNKTRSYQNSKVPSMPEILREREVGMSGRQHFSKGDKCQISSRFLPNQKAIIDQYRSKAFCGNYSKDGDLLITACQDSNIRVYDTRNSHFQLMKTIQARDVGWSVLDVVVSPDGSNFIYSSWSECLHLCNILGSQDLHEPLPLYPDERRFCIFSLRFSHDGKEVVCGASDECLYIYDLEAHQRILKIHSHEYDVNSVAFADATSQILFSGGDDGLCKVWDRRTLSEDHPKPVGILAGHLCGITYVDPKGDGRHLITNSKDQTIKLWDMRSFSPAKGEEASRRIVSAHNWDYRWHKVPKKFSSSKRKIIGDTSLMTYRGHSVLQTLIRCHFSPMFTTSQQFIYTGCAAGRVVIYDALTGKIVSTLIGHRNCVRDVSWHPYKSEIVSSSWDGCVAKWSYWNRDVFDSEIEKVEADLKQSMSSGPRRSKRLEEQKQRRQVLSMDDN